jgi:hypothetical protein
MKQSVLASDFHFACGDTECNFQASKLSEEEIKESTGHGKRN